jgi:hypothetical protein
VRAPSFRQVCQYTGHIAANIADQTLIAFGGALDHRAAHRSTAAHSAFNPETSAASSPLAADDPAAVLPPDAAAGSLTFDELPTSELLNRAATTLIASTLCISLAGYAAAVPTEDVDRFTTELRDRAAQFAAHGD